MSLSKPRGWAAAPSLGAAVELRSVSPRAPPGHKDSHDANGDACPGAPAWPFQRPDARAATNKLTFCVKRVSGPGLRLIQQNPRAAHTLVPVGHRGGGCSGPFLGTRGTHAASAPTPRSALWRGRSAHAAGASTRQRAARTRGCPARAQHPAGSDPATRSTARQATPHHTPTPRGTARQRHPAPHTNTTQHRTPAPRRTARQAT